MIELKLTKEQYEDLLKLIYLGNWMINAIRIDDVVRKYEDLESYVFSFAHKAGLGEMAIYDQAFKGHFPTRKFEDNPELQQYIDDYEEDNFWEGLIERLAARDFYKTYTKEQIKKMSREERFVKQETCGKKYEKEINDHGIGHLIIDDKYR